jgi:class 3 adenylate cyclase
MSSALCQWLEKLGLAQYSDRFEADDIDLDVIPSLSEQDLEKLGVSMGHRKRLLKAIAELNGAPSSSVASDTMAVAPGGPSLRTTNNLSPRAYTPKHLADKILQSKSALEGERKQVTVLFADVKGSMELAEQLDPEQWHTILDRFFAILTDGVHRFEGTVNQYTGDGIMALFGAPIAHEDHAQRACYAALHLRDEIARYATEVKREYGVGFSARMGLNSGDVVVGRIGDDLRMDYTAQGQTVGLAQRMEALASPDTCYLTGATTALVQGYFALEDLGDFQVKGVRAPVRVHRLAGAGAARTRLDVSRARGLTRFVGRDTDMATLEAALEQAQAGHGQVVGVVAEAGTGKSRLCFEFTEHCRARGMIVNEGHAVAHGKNIPYLPMLQVFRGYYGITEQDDDRTAREKIAGRMLLLDDTFRDVLPVLFEFFGVPDPDRPVPRMDPEAKQRQLFAVLRRLVQGADPRIGAESRVTLIEDLHWFDAGSEAFLEQWVDALAGSSGFLLVNFRPEYRAGWMQKSYYHQLPLAPLGPDATRKLLEDLLGTDPSARGLAETIHARTGGNPFFTEEAVQSLIESGHLQGMRGNYRLVTPIERLTVPASVQAVLAARIDRLPERETQVLQTAAVIGREFAEPILYASAEVPEGELRAALAALKAHEFVYEQTLYPVAEYAFKHPLTQEVALGSQLHERRRRTHAAVARATESAHAAKLDEQAALLAHHWEEAGEGLIAARWHRRAAGWVGRNDPVQGVRHMQRVLALTDGLGASEECGQLRFDACTSLLSLGWRVGLSAEEAEAIFAEGRELAALAGSVDKAIALRVGYGATLGFRGNLRRYHELTREAVDLIDDSTSRGPAATALAPGLGYASFLLGRLAEAQQLNRRAVALAAGDPNAGVESVGFSVWGQALQADAECTAYLGCLAEAQEIVRQAIQVSRSHNLPEALAWGLGVLVTVRHYVGEYADQSAADRSAEEARRCALEAVQIAERVGSPFSRSHAYRVLGVAHMLHGAWNEASVVLEEALALAREHSGLEYESNMLALVSRAYLGANDTAGARVRAVEAIACAHTQGALFFECSAELALARALRADLGGAASDEIERCLTGALHLVGETGGRVLEPQIIEEQARLAALRGDRAAAAAELQRAHALYVEIGATGHAERLRKELGS